MQSNAAPCQSEVLVLKKVVMLKGVTLEIVLPTPSPPQFFGKLEKEFKTLAKQLMDCGPKRPKDAPRATVWRKVQRFGDPGHH